LAFTTINGASATDRVSFVGTDGEDILATFSTLTAFVGAQGANDTITAQNTTGLVDWQVKSGAGNDTVTFRSDMIGGRVNGNGGTDTIDLDNVLSGAAVFGGQNDDFINTGVVAQSRVNGNLGNDTISVGVAPLTGVDGADGVAFNNQLITVDGDAVDVLDASIFGGQGSDFIRVTSTQIENTIIGGNLGDDFIDVFYNNGDIINGATIEGGAGNDTVSINYRTAAAQALGVNGTGAGWVIDLGEGNDLVTSASGRNDTIDGGAGNDTINAAGGSDTLTGGVGQDQFNVLDALATWLPSGNADVVASTDVITDWTRDTAAGTANNGDFFGIELADYAIDPVTGTVADLAFDYISSSMVTGQPFASAAAALTAANARGTGIYLVGIGASAGNQTAYAIFIQDNADLTAGNIAGVGAVQLGATGVYTNRNIATALTADQFIAI
jgi:Ca2+-binding RTX toxin-like protein